MQEIATGAPLKAKLDLKAKILPDDARFNDIEKQARENAAKEHAADNYLIPDITGLDGPSASDSMKQFFKTKARKVSQDSHWSRVLSEQENIAAECCYNHFYVGATENELLGDLRDPLSHPRIMIDMLLGKNPKEQKQLVQSIVDRINIRPEMLSAEMVDQDEDEDENIFE